MNLKRGQKKLFKLKHREKKDVIKVKTGSRASRTISSDLTYMQLGSYKKNRNKISQKMFLKITVKNFPNLIRNTNPQYQEAR